MLLNSNKYAMTGTGAIRTEIPPFKPNREITKVTNSQNTKRTNGQPSGQLFPTRWLLSNPNQTKNKCTNIRLNITEYSDT